MRGWLSCIDVGEGRKTCLISALRRNATGHICKKLEQLLLATSWLLSNLLQTPYKKTRPRVVSFLRKRHMFSCHCPFWSSCLLIPIRSISYPTSPKRNSDGNTLFVFMIAKRLCAIPNYSYNERNIICSAKQRLIIDLAVNWSGSDLVSKKY